MFRILCYGDSNTYGFDPETGKRFSEEERWTGILGKLLGEKVKILEEGCNGRTATAVPEDEPWKYGHEPLLAILNSHKPLDLVILMLGTNDLKDEFALSAEEIALTMEGYLMEIKGFLWKKQGYVPQVLLVAPPKMGDMSRSPFGYEFGPQAVEKSLKLPALYEAAAQNTGSLFVDGSRVAASRADALHLDAAGHERLARKLAEKILE